MPLPSFERMADVHAAYGELVEDPTEVFARFARGLNAVRQEKRQAILNIVVSIRKGRRSWRVLLNHITRGEGHTGWSLLGGDPCGGCMDYIFSRLALGNVREAQADPPVDAILNISEFHYPTTRIYRYLYFPDGVYIQPLGLIGECTQFIHEQLRSGRRGPDSLCRRGHQSVVRDRCRLSV